MPLTHRIPGSNAAPGGGRNRAIRLLALAFGLVAATGQCGEILYFPLQGIELADQRADTIACADHLASILRAARSWASDNADQPPPSLQVLTNDLPSPVLLFCPANCRAQIATNWAQVPWDNLDYEWTPPPDWDANPTNIACRCRIHENYARVEGSAVAGPYRSGWPRITASPMDAYAAPAEEVRFDIKVAPDSISPISFQWRRAQLHYVTNIVCVTNTIEPPEIVWQTNLTAEFIITNLPGQTNSTLLIPSAQAADSDFYSVTISNRLGMACSRQCRLLVADSLAGISTNAAWTDAQCVNNLNQVWLLARIWSADHQGLFPQSFADMTNAYNGPVFGWPAELFCRADTNRAPPLDWGQVDLSDTSYGVVQGGRPSSLDPFCRCRAHGYYVAMGGTAMLRPWFNSIRRLPDKVMELNFRPFAGRENVLEASTDLVDWTVLGDFGSDPADAQYLDSEVLEQRFYRLRLR